MRQLRSILRSTWFGWVAWVLWMMLFYAGLNVLDAATVTEPKCKFWSFVEKGDSTIYQVSCGQKAKIKTIIEE